MTAAAGVAPGAGIPLGTGARRGLAAGLRAALGRVAARAPARVFVLEGLDPPAPVAELALAEGLCVVDTPRSATVLLVAGRLPAALDEVGARVHDAMAHPRGVVWWTDDAPQGVAPRVESPAWLVRPSVVRHATAAGRDAGGALRDVAAAVHGVHAALCRGERVSDPALLPDVDPAPWRGVGPFGQGGAGMTGGVPYGRPMAERAPDRDGLELDQLPLRVGPFFAPFPAGLALDVKLQGDVVQEASVPGNAFAGSTDPVGTDVRRDPLRAALDAPVLVTDLERARAAHHLRWLAHMLRVHGLGALGRRAVAAAAALRDGLPAGIARDVLTLGRLLERTRALGWATAGVGIVAPERARGLGPVARAAGLAEDARQGDPAYVALGFTPVVQSGGDARARWRQRIAEAVQSLELAARAGDRRTGGPGVAIEGPRGPLFGTAGREAVPATPSVVLLALLPDLLRGQEWGDAVTTVISLDLDMREAAPAMDPLGPPPAPKPADAMGGGMGGMPGMGAMPGMGRGDEHAGHGGAHGHRGGMS